MHFVRTHQLVLMQYEPELFPGLIYRMKQPKIVLLIFVSGKIVLTGAKVMQYFSISLRRTTDQKVALNMEKTLVREYLDFRFCFICLLTGIFVILQVREETYTAFENIYPVLTEFRKNQQWYYMLSLSLSHIHTLSELIQICKRLYI